LRLGLKIFFRRLAASPFLPGDVAGPRAFERFEMGKSSTTAAELANGVLTNSFTATGQSATLFVTGARGINCTVWGTFVGTIRPERSFDGGTTWFTIKKDTAGTDLSFTAADSLVIDEPENGVLYRMNCTAFASGTINCRLSF
jgi:hypothetical protein